MTWTGWRMPPPWGCGWHPARPAARPAPAFWAPVSGTPHRHPVQAVDDGVGIAVLSVELPHDVTGSFACGAAFSLGKAFLVLQTQRRQRRFPESSPHPLGVEHQAVHIKNHAVDHGRTPFIITLSVIASQCHLSRRRGCSASWERFSQNQNLKAAMGSPFGGAGNAIGVD